jgi:hypothetical protein
MATAQTERLSEVVVVVSGGSESQAKFRSMGERASRWQLPPNPFVNGETANATCTARAMTRVRAPSGTKR